MGRLIVFLMMAMLTLIAFAGVFFMIYVFANRLSGNKRAYRNNGRHRPYRREQTAVYPIQQHHSDVMQPERTNTVHLNLNELDSLLPALIDRRASFEVWQVDSESMFDAVGQIEAAIESQRLTCRIYTKGRILAAAAGIFSFGAGIAALIGIAAHNVLTRNPDYEICRDLANSRLSVVFKH